MKLDIDKLNNFLKVSLICTNLFIINTYLIFFSIISFGILTPSLVGATFYEIEKILQYDMIGLHKRFFLNVFRNFKYTIGKIFLLSLFLSVLCVTIIVFNRYTFQDYSLVQLSIVLGAQILMLFQLTNIIQLSLIQIFIYNNKNINQVLKNSFIIVNTNILKFLLASVSIVICFALVKQLTIFIVVFLSLYHAFYYISVNNLVKRFYDKYYINK